MNIRLRVDQEIGKIKKERDVLELINKKKSIKSLDDIEIRAAALSLSALYNGMESILVNILLDRGAVNKGETSLSRHKDILKKSLAEKVISENTMNELKMYLGFRHFIRHAYSFEINPETIEAILDKVSELVETFFNEVRISISE